MSKLLRIILTAALTLLLFIVTVDAQTVTESISGSLDVQATVTITPKTNLAWPTSSDQAGAVVDNDQAGKWNLSVGTGNTVQVSSNFPTALTDGSGNSVPVVYGGTSSDIVLQNLCDDGNGGVATVMFGANDGSHTCTVGDDGGSGRSASIGDTGLGGNAIGADLTSPVPAGTYTATVDLTLAVQ